MKLAPHIRNGFVLVVILFRLPLDLLGANRSQEELPSGLKRAILNVHPKAQVIERTDIADSDCEDIRQSPGLVQGDFNGDGLPDYAALLKIGGTEKHRVWEGKTWTLVELRLVVFLAEKGGRFRSIVLENLAQYMPVMVMLDLQRPGPIREYAEIEHEKRKIIHLKRDSIAKVHCGRSETIFYWDDTRKRFRAITVSD